MPLSASQSLSREALAVSVLQGFQNSGSSHHLVLSDSPDDFTYKCMPLLLLQTFRFSPSLERVQGRCTLEPAVWSFLGLSFVTAGDVDRMISNAPRNIQCLRQQAQHETWEWALPSHRAESPSTQEQFLHLCSHCNWQGCGEVINVSLPRLKLDSFFHPAYNVLMMMCRSALSPTVPASDPSVALPTLERQALCPRIDQQIYFLRTLEALFLYVFGSAEV